MARTISRTATFTGVGLHGGQPVRLSICPAPVDAGIVFLRTDVTGDAGRIPARFDLVVDTRLCTRLANAHGVGVGTVEHLMAALAGCGVTDALIRLDGPEVPIMDGSAAPFVDAILAAGVRDLGGLHRAIRIRRPVRIDLGDRSAALYPEARFDMGFRIAFDDAAIGQQALSLNLTGDGVIDALADCRTFGRLAEVERLRAHGLGLGGGLENAIIVDGDRVLNPGGLRRPDEFVRHKMLDAVGDLYLAGAPIIGRYAGDRAGHEVTNRLLHALFAEPGAWEWVDAAPGQVPMPSTVRQKVTPPVAAMAV